MKRASIADVTETMRKRIAFRVIHQLRAEKSLTLCCAGFFPEICLAEGRQTGKSAPYY
jgi:hypothetical protein